MPHPIDDPVIPARLRDWLYPVVLAALPLLATWGILAESDIPLYAALAAALLGAATSTAYRPSKTVTSGPPAHTPGASSASIPED